MAILALDPKPIVTSKTLWFNLVDGLMQITGILPPPYGIAVSVIGNIILRTWFTDRPINGLVTSDA